MATCLQQLAGAWTLNLKTECVDVKRSAKHDLSLPKVRQGYLDRIAAKEFDAVLLSPPCASFSRAPWANFRGPRPVRSYDCPRGLQTHGEHTAIAALAVIVEDEELDKKRIIHDATHGVRVNHRTALGRRNIC